MTLPELFYFLNFFVRPILKKWRQKCAKICSKFAPHDPHDPPRPTFSMGGDVFYNNNNNKMFIFHSDKEHFNRRLSNL